MNRIRVVGHLQTNLRSLAYAFVSSLFFHFAPGGFGALILRPMTGVELERQVIAEKACGEKIVQMMRAANTWSTDNSGKPPPGFQVLTNDLTAPSTLFCPAVFHDTIPTDWANVKWEGIDYKWLPEVDWNNFTNVACICSAHNIQGRVDGTAAGSGYRTGWPLLTATPHDVYATPGVSAVLELKMSPDTTAPVAYQWRKSHLEYATNVAHVRDPEQPTVVRWVTNVVPVFIGTNLPGETQASLSIAALETNHSGFYSVAISNALGVTLSRQVLLDVSSSYAGIETNEAWSDALCANNLREVGVLAGIWGLSRNHLLPRSLAEMTNAWGQPLFGWPLTLFCRADTNRVPASSWAEVDFSNTSYEISPWDWMNPFEVFCQCRAHGYYVTVDGMVMLKPVFTGMKRVGSDSVEIRFRTFAGRENVLETSSDLVEWRATAIYGPFPDDILLTELVSKKPYFYRLRLQ